MYLSMIQESSAFQIVNQVLDACSPPINCQTKDFKDSHLRHHFVDGCKFYTLSNTADHNRIQGNFCGRSAENPNADLLFYGKLHLWHRELECSILKSMPTKTVIFEKGKVVGSIHKTTELTKGYILSPVFHINNTNQTFATIPIDIDRNLQKIQIGNNAALSFPLLIGDAPAKTGRHTLVRQCLNLFKTPSRHTLGSKLLSTDLDEKQLSGIDIDLLIFSLLIIKSEYIPYDFSNVCLP